MLRITGQLDHKIDRKAGPAHDPSRQWDETTLVIKDFGETHYCKVGRNFGPVPDDGATIDCEVSVRAYPKKSGDGAGYEYIATRLLAVETSAPVAVKAS